MDILLNFLLIFSRKKRSLINKSSERNSTAKSLREKNTLNHDNFFVWSSFFVWIWKLTFSFVRLSEKRMQLCSLLRAIYQCSIYYNYYLETHLEGQNCHCWCRLTRIEQKKIYVANKFFFFFSFSLGHKAKNNKKILKLSRMNV